MLLTFYVFQSIVLYTLYLFCCVGHQNVSLRRSDERRRERAHPERWTKGKSELGQVMSLFVGVFHFFLLLVHMQMESDRFLSLMKVLLERLQFKELHLRNSGYTYVGSLVS